MRARTLVALGILVLAVGGLAVAAFAGSQQSGVDVTATWASDTVRDVAGNHHAPAAGRVGDDPMAYAPVSGRTETPNCGLVALDGATGERRWSHSIAAANCTIHSVADPTLADFDGDGQREVIAVTSERAVVALHPRTGAVELRHDLSSYGYTKPVVADLAGDERPEIVVVDVAGEVTVLRADGTVAWSRRLDSRAWGQPTVADLDGDGAPELAVATDGLTVFEGDGSRSWARSDVGSITWTATGDADGDDAVEIVVATPAGRVSAVDGATGDREWTREFGTYAAVHAFGDGDADGAPEVYVAATDGRLRALDAATGETAWTTTLTTGDVQMAPPPALGDVDGDGAPELVAVTNDGVVSVVDPASGTVLGSHERDAAVYTHPRLADLDDDGDREVLVMYARGRVVAFDVE